MSRVYRAPGPPATTNLVFSTFEIRTEDRWVLQSRTYYIAGEETMCEEEFDKNGLAQKLFLVRGDRIVGFARKGAEITGLLPEEEIARRIAIRKSGAEAGAAIGAFIGEAKDESPKTSDEIATDLGQKLQDLKSKQAEQPKQ